MKTTKDEIELLRHHANVVPNRDQGALILSVLDDLNAAEASAERLRAAIQTTLRKFPTWALDDLRAALAERPDRVK